MGSGCYDSFTPTLLKSVLFFCHVVSFVYAEVPPVVFFIPRKTLQFQWTGAETGTFLLETNISGEQIMAVRSVI